jgi:hypothetical protein
LSGHEPRAVASAALKEWHDMLLPSGHTPLNKSFSTLLSKPVVKKFPDSNVKTGSSFLNLPVISFIDFNFLRAATGQHGWPLKGNKSKILL